MSKPLLAGLGVLFSFAPCSTRAQSLRIDHQPVACATAGKFPRLEARFAPAESVAAARVVFQGQTADWYSVAMKPEGVAYAGVLPKPNKELKSFRYYIEVTDKALGTNRTADFIASVVDASTSCQGKTMAGALASAAVNLQGPAGATALPAGFASTGVVAGSAAGTSAAAGAGASAVGAGGGIGTTALVIGGVAVAGGAAAAVAAKGGDDGSRVNSSQNQSQPIRLDVVILTSSTTATGPITTPFIDVSACRPGTTFGGGPITLRSDGSFDESWNITTPALRVAGRADASGLQATLTCLSGGGPTGSMSAAGSGYSLTGTFAFGPSQGTISVRRAP